MSSSTWNQLRSRLVDHQDFCPRDGQSLEVLTADSRQKSKTGIFVAICGTARDGHEFIDDILSSTEMWIVAQEGALDPGVRDPRIILVPDTRRALADLACAWYDHPSRKLKLIGITGTSGKTTTTYLLESIFSQSEKNVGVIGTVDIRCGGVVIPSELTTPGPVELNALLNQMAQKGSRTVIMEVSSHALDQRRPSYLHFDGILFNNLSPEHLDYHIDMENYYQSKKLLFTEYVNKGNYPGSNPVSALINVDDPFGNRLCRELVSEPVKDLSMKIQGFSTEFKSHYVGRFKESLEGNRGTIELQSEKGFIPISTHLVGNFNCANIAGAASLAHAMGILGLQISNGIEAVQKVPGRLERVPSGDQRQILVDYAHKPDALKKILETLNQLKRKSSPPARLLTVFGCGGDRDKTKRPQMGRIAAEISDYVWVTSDNPRTEDPIAIINEITAGMAGFDDFSVEPDRRQAIGLAIKESTGEDIVLIAGKGHEDYQIIGTKKIHMDDREIAQSYLNKSQ